MERERVDEHLLDRVNEADGLGDETVREDARAVMQDDRQSVGSREHGRRSGREGEKTRTPGAILGLK